MSELEILFPEPVPVLLRGKRALIYPVKLRDFELYGKVAGGFVALLDTASIEQINRYGESNSAAIRKLLRVTTSLTRWQIRRLPSTVSVSLLADVVRVNSGFFADALPMMVRALAGAMSPNA
ncbi:hypothetical protein [Pseudomonas sp. GWSMS-1]|uniref:hypothetical protein n=1 Tax=Pseudomonas sp. GWSMS-1 TaxID=3308997 RepID=UPI003CF0BDBF